MLADEVTRLRTELSLREEECQQMQKTLDEKETTINRLKEENKIIKLGNRLTEGGESTELKLKINQMIRAIDKSLALLKQQTENH
ncbi:MAG: hypothetical protein IJ761_06330 [Bacteroidales bacterium]|nr:hypothetical protein [Bacteroidales bacterium]